MKKKLLNLGLILGLALIVGFSFTSNTEVYAQAGTSSVPCADPIPGVTPSGTSTIRRLCSENCPWKRVYAVNTSTCNLEETIEGLE